MYKRVSLQSARFCLLAAIFFMPFATAPTNIFAGLTILTFLLALFASRQLLEPLRIRPVQLALGLYVLVLLGTLWTTAPEPEVREAVGKYAKLLMLPVAAALCWGDEKTSRRALLAFFAGSTVLAASCYLVWLGWMPDSEQGFWRVGTSGNAYAFKSYITIGILLGFIAMACFRYFSYAGSVRSRALAIAMGIFFAVPTIFLIRGRTGYVVMFVGLVVLSLLYFRKNLKLVAASLLSIVALFCSFYVFSDNVKLRVDDLISELQNYSDTREMNSSGMRMAFYTGGVKLIAAHPVYGTGTGSFSEGFAPMSAEYWPKGTKGHLGRHQPHSEYILMGVQFGVIGLAAYIALLVSLAWTARTARTFESDTLLLLCAIFGVASMFNSLLWDHTEGYWLAILAGCLVAQIHTAAKPAKPQFADIGPMSRPQYGPR